MNCLYATTFMRSHPTPHNTQHLHTMKLLKKLRILLTAFIAAGLSLAPSLLRAEGEDPNTENDISTLVSDADVSLVANPAAPREPGTLGISGKAFLYTFNGNGVITRTLDMQIKNK